MQSRSSGTTILGRGWPVCLSGVEYGEMGHIDAGMLLSRWLKQLSVGVFPREKDDHLFEVCASVLNNNSEHFALLESLFETLVKAPHGNSKVLQTFVLIWITPDRVCMGSTAYI